jgi:hypothetical protein
VGKDDCGGSQILLLLWDSGERVERSVNELPTNFGAVKNFESNRGSVDK